ncbi:DNA-directed RNA polymerase III 47 kDa polypeptide [Burkholderia vietnamiensis]|nr:DNA-directed RNA polymerase III 47 kDa polypeptide [Burkholderia vietnamiensis]
MGRGRGDGRRVGLTARTGQGGQAGDAGDAEDAARRSTTGARGDPPTNAAGRACLPPDA